jgi:hypothetical protein
MVGCGQKKEKRPKWAVDSEIKGGEKWATEDLAHKA